MLTFINHLEDAERKKCDFPLTDKTSVLSVLSQTDKNFKWANTGATVFGIHPAAKGDNEDDGSDEEVVHSDEIHFEPIVSLPEVGT